MNRNNATQYDNEVWLDISHAFDGWIQRILDTEACHQTATTLQENIEDYLRRQQLDGLLNHHDIAELRYIADVWTKLQNSIACYKIGCEFLKRDIITYLLELHKLRQISDSILIEACLAL